MCFTSARRVAIVALWLGLLSSNAEPLAAGGLPVAGGDRPLLYLQGAAAGAHRGDWVSSADGLDDAHRFFIEVPVGLETLEIDLFDADVLAGGANELDKARDRIGDTRVRYQLYDPEGQAVATRFVTGDHRGPRGADRAWLRFYSSRTQVDGKERFAETFDATSYRANDGSRAFSGPWIESGNAPGIGFDSGVIRLRGGRLELSNRGDIESWGLGPSIERELDLSSFIAAGLAFDFEVSAGVDFEDSVWVEVSSDGGESFHTIDELIGLEGGESGHRAYDISDHISEQTRVRFRVSRFYAGPDESLAIDNLEIRGASTAQATPPLAGHWMLSVDMSSRLNRRAEAENARDLARTNGKGANALGLRAHDGDPGHAGTELAIYAGSFLSLGIYGRSGSRQDYALFPYVTGGCTLRIHDFDWDARQENHSGSLQLLSRRGARVFGELSRSPHLSGDRAWNTTLVSGWTPPSGVSDYGIWSLAVEIADPDAGNFATLRADGGNSADNLRIYLPSDRGGAPIKPYFSQTLAFIEGPGNPPRPDERSIYAVTLSLVHPRGAAGVLDVGPEDSRPLRLAVSASIPDPAGYLGSVSISAGSLFTEPKPGASGQLRWHPGRLKPGDVATLVYHLEAGAGVDVTGRPGAGGTSARVLDVTGTPMVLGELCQLSIPADSPLPVFDSDLEPPPPSIERIHISGEVKAPGTFPYRTAMTLRQALALAGGLTEYAAVTEAVVFRIQKGEELQIRISIDGTLFPGDRLEIPRISEYD